MRITVATIDDAADVLTLEISSDLSIQDLKVVIESESNFGITAADMVLMHNGRPLQTDTQTLEQCNIKNDDVLTCQRRRAMTTNEIGGVGQTPDALMREFQRIFQTLRSNANMRERIRRSNPELLRAVETNNIEAFIAAMLRQQQSQRPTFAPTDDDLLDPQIQRRIEEEITMENVRDNMEHAYEYAPEFFGHVVMLYINCKVNGHSVKAFVDSGAQMTIMSKACAERCGIMRLIDRRFSGIARGVGTQEILGRIHLAQLEVEKQFFAISLSVLGDQSMDMLIGLDMLRRHRCIIDLEKNVLRIEDVVETAFLAESELPEHAKLSNDPSSPAPNDPQQAHTQSAAATANSNSSTTSIPSPTTSHPPSLPAAPFPENTIRDIMKKGFTREEVIQELRIHQGDAMKTTVSLMTKSLSKPRSKK